MPSWAISLLSVVVGGVLAYAGSLHLQRLRNREEAQRARREALGMFFSRLAIVVGVVRQWPADPEPTPLERMRELIVGRSERLRLRDWIRAQERTRQIFGENFYEPLFLFLEAYGRLRLMPLDTRVRATIDRAVDYVERLAALRTDEVKREWEAVRAAFLEAVEASGDAPALEGVEERLLGRKE